MIEFHVNRFNGIIVSLIVYITIIGVNKNTMVIILCYVIICTY